MSDNVIHLISNESHDESEIWCESTDYYLAYTLHVGAATCRDCLLSAAEYGARAITRYMELLADQVTDEAAP